MLETLWIVVGDLLSAPPPLEMEVANALWAGNNLLFGAVAALFPDRAATPFTIGCGLAMLAGQCGLAGYFSFMTTSGPCHAQPGFTAHQLVYCE